ncbi:MAG: glycosyltransferase family 4 protein, partial [Flavobacteriaceae bacterium]|nr:glycosyltransferase family 4 protein [Flavobacteriaceae bacterium]
MNKKLHILFLCGWYPSRVFPTNGDFIQRHAEAVSQLHDVTVIHIVSDRNATQSILIDTINSNGITTHVGYVQFTSNPIIKWIRFYKAYTQVLKKINTFDIVHLNTLFPFGLFAFHLKYKKKTPYIISEHWTGYHTPQHISFLQKSISKIITQKASFISPVSNDLKNAMLKTGLKGNYHPIPNVVDLSIFKPSEEKETQFTITHVSSMLDQHKNITGMLQTAKLLENEIGVFTWKFIGGSSVDYDALIKTLNFNKANIQFIDHLTQKEVATHVQTSNVFVMFSNYENLPCVILEAFSCGIPVISTNVGGISEYFPSEFGYLIDPNNKEQLLQKIKQVYQHPISKSKSMHLYAKKHFSKEIIAVRFS